MRQEQFKNRFTQSAQPQSDIDRKWRLYLEQKNNDELLEMAQQQYTANNAPVGPGAGGSRETAQLTDYYTFNVNFFDPADGDSVLVRLNNDGTSEAIPLENDYKFYGYTVFTGSNDDATGLYFVSQDEDSEDMVFGKIDMVTGQVTEITRSFPIDTYAPPNSLWYVGGNTFYFLSESYVINGEQVLPKLVSLNTQGASSLIAVTEPLVYSTQAMFSWMDLWAIVSPPTGLEVPPFPYLAGVADVEGVLQLQGEPIPITLEGAPQGPSKPIVISGVTVDDELDIIVNMVYGPLTEGFSYGCLARLDLGTAVATYIQPMKLSEPDLTFSVAAFPLPQNP